MTRNKALAMGIEAIKRLANDLYGKGSKYQPDKRVNWERWQEAIKKLEELRDEK